MNKSDIQSGASLPVNLQITAKASAHKAIATQIAHLALAGHAVHKGNCGDFTVCKYGMTKYCQDFEELQAFSKKLGVTK